MTTYKNFEITADLETRTIEVVNTNNRVEFSTHDWDETAENEAEAIEMHIEWMQENDQVTEWAKIEREEWEKYMDDADKKKS